jgi:hypothetical protein
VRFRETSASEPLMRRCRNTAGWPRIPIFDVFVLVSCWNYLGQFSKNRVLGQPDSRRHIKTGGLDYSRMSTGGTNLLTGSLSVCCVRYKGGVNLIQALVWNVGTCRSDVKG